MANGSDTARPRMSRRRLTTTTAAGVGSGVAATAIAACAVGGRSDAGAGQPGQAGAPALKSGVTLLMMQNGTQPEGEKKLQVFKLFEQKHPGIKAELDNTGNPDKVQAMTAGGTPPDVFWFPPSLFLQYYRRGFFVDLSALMRRDKYDLSDFAEKGLAQFEWEKKQIAMPKDCPSRGMFFNLALFQEQGVAPPPANYTDQSWTWDRFLDAAQKLTRDKGGVTQFGLNSGTGYRQWSPWVHGNGGELLNKDATECTLHEPPAVEALQFLQDLRVKHRVWVQQADIQQGATFQLGRNAITEAAPPQVGTFQREITGFEWDVTHTPRGRSGKFSASGGGVGQGISSGSKNQEEAWALLKHVMSPEALMIEIVQDRLNLTARKSLANSKEYLETGRAPRNIKVFVDGLAALRPDPQATNWGEVEAAMTKELAPLWTGEKSAREVANAVKRAIDPLLQQAEAKRRL